MASNTGNFFKSHPGEISCGNHGIDVKNIPLFCFDTDPVSVTGPFALRQDSFPEKAVLAILDDKTIYDFALRTQSASIGSYKSIVKDYPFFKVSSCGCDVCVAQTPVGAPAAVQIMEYLISCGARSFISVGSCGALEEIEEGSFLIPVSAVRDEGTSYHYLPAGKEVSFSESGIRAISKTLKQYHLSCRTVKTWTTDAFFRETESKILKRRAEGCSIVEMECSALAACASFRGAEFASLLFAADSLSGFYDERTFGKGCRATALYLAVEAASLI